MDHFAVFRHDGENRNAADGAGVRGLAAPFGIKGRAVKDNAPPAVRPLPDSGDGRGKAFDVGVEIVEAAGRCDRRSTPC